MTEVTNTNTTADANSAAALDAMKAAAGTESKEPVTTLSMDTRRIFTSPETASAYLLECFTKFADFAEQAIVSPFVPGETAEDGKPVESVTFDGEAFAFNPAIFGTDLDGIMVCMLATRAAGSTPAKCKGVVIVPCPTLAQFGIAEDTTGRDWLDRVIGTELQRIAVAGLRDRKVEGVNVETDITSPDVVATLPINLSQYISGSSRGNSTLLAWFESYWKTVKRTLDGIFPQWKRAQLSKRDLKLCLTSRQYAMIEHSALEEFEHGGKTFSLFDMAIGMFKKEGTAKGEDVSIFDTWNRDRSTTVLTAKQVSEEPGDADKISAFLSAFGMAEDDEDTNQEG